MKKILMVLGLLFLPVLAYSQQDLGTLPYTDSMFVRDSAANDMVMQSYKNTQEIDEVILWAKVDTSALDSINFYVVLDQSHNNLHWTAFDSTAVFSGVADTLPKFKRITAVGAQYLRIRVNGLRGTQSGVPTVPISVKAIFRPKTQ